MEVQFLNLTEQEFLDIRLFKFLPLSHAIESISNDSLWFSNPEEWNDPYESYFMNNAYEDANDSIDFPLKDNLFATCFSTISRTEAQWKSYSENGMAVMLDISPRKLLDSLKKLSADYDVYIGRVAYLPTYILKKESVAEIIASIDGSCSDVNNTLKALLLMLCKRKAFKYESEVRVFLVPRDEMIKYQKGVKVKLNLKEITERYTISPLKKDLQRAIKACLLSIAGVKNVNRSTLYDQAVNKVLTW